MFELKVKGTRFFTHELFEISPERGGALSNWLAERNVGDIVRVSLPFGEFRTAEAKGAVVFIATGVGISPFLSAPRSRRFGLPHPHRGLFQYREKTGREVHR